MKTIFKKIGLRLHKFYQFHLNYAYVFENGWYKMKRRDAWVLFREDGSLVADKLSDCRVFTNGWYELKTKEGSALFREDETLVADKLIRCYVYDNGDYEMETKEGSALYSFNGKLIKKTS